MLILTVVQGPDKGRTFELPDNEPQLLGRSSEALPISDMSVSRRHAELTPDDGAWFVRDLSSQNGTFINGEKIAARTRLRPGDQIRVGQTLFVFGKVDDSRERMVRVVGSKSLDATIEKTLGGTWAGVALGPSPEESATLDEPDPRPADHLKVIYRLTTLVTQRALDTDKLLGAVLELVFDQFRPERGCIMLVEPAPPMLPGAEPGPTDVTFTPACVRHRTSEGALSAEALAQDPEARQISISRTILMHTVRTGEGVLSTNAMQDARFASGDSVQRLHIRSALCSPIRFGERTFGMIYIDNSIANSSFTADQLALLNAIGQHTGLALSNAELYSQKLQSQRLAAIGETVATLSHSIKNILQGLRGGADVVEMGLRKDDLKIARGGWGIVQRNLDRIISLTMNMLAFSRQRKPETEMVQLAALLSDCASIVEAACAQKQVALIVDVDPEMPPVPLDASLIHQAVMNLVTNAIDAAPPGDGAVTLKAQFRAPTPPPPPGGAVDMVQAARRAGRRPTLTPALDALRDADRAGRTPPQPAPTPGQPAETRTVVEISVIDNGPGIPHAKQRWVFEPFNTTKGLRGTGLGLAVAKRIAEDHGGRIVLESAEGKGACFRMVLPVDPQGKADPAATAGHS